ncbi:uncharacterized protein LOC119648575 [Hermetia illucens]|uniref:uncharacterized protein LOC119648575 n=1 Tax=Hermetia illucens TaxID=343691 RepID=UPI0018CC009B|nr:uncharacterized protein LOC119648575 [Hermetia illucens]
MANPETPIVANPAQAIEQVKVKMLGPSDSEIIVPASQILDGIARIIAYYKTISLNALVSAQHRTNGGTSHLGQARNLFRGEIYSTFSKTHNSPEPKPERASMSCTLNVRQ